MRFKRARYISAVVGQLRVSSEWTCRVDLRRTVDASLTSRHINRILFEEGRICRDVCAQIIITYKKVSHIE